MKVNVEYNSYSAEIERASIPIKNEENEGNFTLSVVSEQIEDVEAPELFTVGEKKLVFKVEDELGDSNLALEMTKVEARQFLTLASQIVKQL